MDFIIKRSGKDEKSVAWSFFSFSSCFIDLIPNFVSNIGFRISRWRETELKGNPVQIRNYPRSCKFYPPIVWGSVVTFLATGYCENREGATTETSQKTCRTGTRFVAFGWKASERFRMLRRIYCRFCKFHSCLCCIGSDRCESVVQKRCISVFPKGR